MRRYKFLNQEDVYSALNRLRNAFLAAKAGTEVESIINGLLTHDEKMKIGRRILIAELLHNDLTVEEISELLNVGRSTIATVNKNIDSHPDCFNLIAKRSEKIESEYESKKHTYSGSSKLIYKKKIYSGFKRKNVKR